MQLYDFVLDFARQSGCYNVTLNVWADNPNVLHFYEAVGLRVQKIGMQKILSPKAPAHRCSAGGSKFSLSYSAAGTQAATEYSVTPRMVSPSIWSAVGASNSTLISWPVIIHLR